MAHRVGIIGGDGIGPEVVGGGAESRARRGRRARHRRLRPRRPPLPRDRRGAARLRARRAARLRRDPARRGRHARGPARRARARSAACRCASRSTSTSTCDRSRPGRAGYNDGVDFLVVRENTEGTYAGEGGFLRQGTPQRDRDAGLGEHPHGRRAVRALRVRSRAESRRSQAPHARAQDERAHVRGRPLAAHVRRGRAPSTPT